MDCRYDYENQDLNPNPYHRPNGEVKPYQGNSKQPNLYNNTKSINPNNRYSNK